MKKKIVAIMLSTALAMSFTACGNSDTSKADTKKEETSKDGGTLKAEKNILSVEITLPASLVEDDSATLTDEAKSAGVKEITKNDDGSITMKMTKSAHKKLLNSIKESVDQSNDEMLSDKENYPSFDSITYNDDLTEFTVNVDSSLYGGMQGFAALAFYMEGNIYQALNAVPEDQLKTVVNFVNKDSGEVIESGDSSSMANSQSDSETIAQ